MHVAFLINSDKNMQSICKSTGTVTLQPFYKPVNDLFVVWFSLFDIGLAVVSIPDLQKPKKP